MQVGRYRHSVWQVVPEWQKNGNGQGIEHGEGHNAGNGCTGLGRWWNVEGGMCEGTVAGMGVEGSRGIPKGGTTTAGGCKPELEQEGCSNQWQRFLYNSGSQNGSGNVAGVVCSNVCVKGKHAGVQAAWCGNAR